MTTRANVEAVLVSRIGGWLTNSGLDGTTVNGTNADLNDPIGYGIRTAGGTVASAALVTDADVATVTSDDLDLLLDAAELRALESCLSNYALVDAKAGPVEAKASQFADRLERTIARLRSQISATYGIGGSASLSGGTLTLAFMETE